MKTTAPAAALSTRDRLVAAAVRVVARDGLEAASVKTIAAEADVTPGLLHYHFPSKEALLEAALRQALEGYLAAVRARRDALPPTRLLDAVFEDARAAIAADGEFFRLRLAFAAKALADPALAAVMRDLNAAAIEENARSFALARGAKRPAARDRALAATLKAAFDGVLLAALVTPDFPLEAAADILRTGARAWQDRP
ncbi:MAG: TetR family transcriptional regulator [Alphaproteobacteria bacterium]|nr:TetR family transcriptional regulator [Alphaproteobacteria bacterium]